MTGALTNGQTASPPLTDGIPASEEEAAAYSFPIHRLKQHGISNDKEPLVLVACGAFSPLTFLHLRMFEMASDYIRLNTHYEVIGGYLSPVSDAYKKDGLADGRDRVNMCLSAIAPSSWLMVDPYETVQYNADGSAKYTPTAAVLQHAEHELNEVLGGVEAVNGSRKKVKVAMLAGADLMVSMAVPDLWAPADLDTILGNYGAYVIERADTNIEDVMSALRKWEANIVVIQQTIVNDMSSTKIRAFLEKNLSVRYLIPDSVIDYIEERKLYAKQ